VIDKKPDFAVSRLDPNHTRVSRLNKADLEITYPTELENRVPNSRGHQKRFESREDNCRVDTEYNPLAWILEYNSTFSYRNRRSR
jgi:hypothetical protein